MRNLSFILFLASCFAFNSCDKGPGVEIPFQAYIIIPAGLNTGLSHHFLVGDLPGINNTLSDAQPARVTLTVEYGESNLDFIHQAFFYTLKDPVRQEMAYQTNLPFTGYAEAELYPSILDMSSHITQDRFDMQLKMIFRSIPVTETRIRIDFTVQAILEG
jgi:hypothetical protein